MEQLAQRRSKARFTEAVAGAEYYGFLEDDDDEHGFWDAAEEAAGDGGELVEVEDGEAWEPGA
jgi:hypothetical protein